MFKRGKIENYVVVEGFTIVEWGDSHGCTETSKEVNIGDEVKIRYYKDDTINIITVNGSKCGEYKLEISYENILNKLEKIK